MDYLNIDWLALKGQDYMKWRQTLAEATIKLFTCSSQVCLSEYNKQGYFHKVRDSTHFEQMKDDWQMNGKVPSNWIAKGTWPGIWTALFNEHNTYSFGSSSLNNMRVYFKDNYFIYDGKNMEHQDLWQRWSAKNLSLFSFKKPENLWKKLCNEQGDSLEERMKRGFYLPFPHHKKFYEDHKFGAAIGYSDYIAAVVMLEDAVERVEFLDVK